MATTERRIYVACLASYNNGHLHGAWIDATQDADDIKAEIAEKVLRTSPYPNVRVGPDNVPSSEEWAIHDYEGFEGLTLSEYESMDKVADLARLLEEHGEAYAKYVDLVGTDHATEEGFQDAYRGEYDSAEAYAEELVEQTHDLKALGTLANYIDYEKFARDMTYEGTSFVDGGRGVYVFGSI